jgi:hypothetical protein
MEPSGKVVSEFVTDVEVEADSPIDAIRIFNEIISKPFDTRNKDLLRRTRPIPELPDPSDPEPEPPWKWRDILFFWK